MTLYFGAKKLSFQPAAVYGPLGSPAEDLYAEHVEPKVAGVLRGKSSAVVLYGPPNSGRSLHAGTHPKCWDGPPAGGGYACVVQQVVDDLFAKVRGGAGQPFSLGFTQ